MSQFFARYRQYRLVGFHPIGALRFAWLVGGPAKVGGMRLSFRR